MKKGFILAFLGRQSQPIDGDGDGDRDSGSRVSQSNQLQRISLNSLVTGEFGRCKLYFAQLNSIEAKKLKQSAQLKQF
ncbi:MAG: hypothetical protein D6680_02080 [Cyanobacteria bacterium J007]|nr:MAG: hypothetical protein D6680_02080 [Cyanobacteria bacterium J007]